MRNVTRNVIVATSALVVAFGLIQLVPYRISNPGVSVEPKWDSPQTRALVVAACYDCHSNETRTPWYGKIAPVSWWLTNHVDDGRAAVNFSEWDRPQRAESRKLVESVREGSMPPSYYTWFGLHSNAKADRCAASSLDRGIDENLRRLSIDDVV